MKNIIYLDVLIILNIYVTYFLLLGSAKLVGEKLKRYRLILGCLAGGVFSLLILFDLSLLWQVLIKLLMGILLVIISFPIKGVKYILKCTFIFFLINFIYGGFMFALWFFVHPSGMVYKNGVAYFNISAIGLAVSTIIAYLVVSLICRFLNKRSSDSEKRSVLISFCGRETELVGFCDTGNKLCDVFSGIPVVVCEYNAISSMLPRKLEGYFKNPLDYPREDAMITSYISKLKLVPVEVVGASLMLPAFKPDKILIDDVQKQAIVAVTDKKFSDGDFQAIINPALL